MSNCLHSFLKKEDMNCGSLSDIIFFKSPMKGKT
jgi:hypothetical protein